MKKPQIDFNDGRWTVRRLKTWIPITEERAIGYWMAFGSADWSEKAFRAMSAIILKLK